MTKEKSAGHEKPAPPKELSTALKGLRFMARKEKPQEVSIRKESKINSTQSQLPETTEPLALSIFASHVSRPTPIVFRKALSFSNESDVLAEIKLRERSRKKSTGAEKEMGRFRSKDQRVYDKESSVSTVDDRVVAQHFARNKKRRRAT